MLQDMSPTSINTKMHIIDEIIQLALTEDVT